VLHQSAGNLSFQSEGWEQRESLSPELDDGEDVYYDDGMTAGSGAGMGRKTLRKVGRKRRHRRKDAAQSADSSLLVGISSRAAASCVQDPSANHLDGKRRCTDLASEAQNSLNKQASASASELCGSGQSSQVLLHLKRGRRSKQTPLKSCAVQNRNQLIQNTDRQSNPLYCNMSSENTGQPYILNVWSQQSQESMSKPSDNKQKIVQGQSQHSTSLIVPSITSKSGRRRHSTSSIKQPVLLENGMRRSSAAIPASPLQVRTVITRSSTKGHCKKMAALASSVSNKVERKKLLWSKRLIASATERQAKVARVMSQKQLGHKMLDTVPFETRSGTRWLNTKLLDNAKSFMITRKNSINSVENVAPAGIKTRSGKVASPSAGFKTSQAGDRKPLGAELHEGHSRLSNVHLMKTLATAEELPPGKANQSTLRSDEINSLATMKQSKSGLVLKLKRRRNRFLVEQTHFTVSKGKGSIYTDASTVTSQAEEGVPAVKSVMCTRSSGGLKPVIPAVQSKQSARLKHIANDLQLNSNIPPGHLKEMKFKSRLKNSVLEGRKATAAGQAAPMESMDRGKHKMICRARRPVKHQVLVSAKLRRLNRAHAPTTQLSSTQTRQKLIVESRGQLEMQVVPTSVENTGAECRKSERRVHQPSHCVTKSDHVNSMKDGKNILDAKPQCADTLCVSRTKPVNQSTEGMTATGRKQELGKKTIIPVDTSQFKENTTNKVMMQRRSVLTRAKFNESTVHESLRSLKRKTVASSVEKNVEDLGIRKYKGHLHSGKPSQLIAGGKNVMIRQMERLKKLTQFSAVHLKAKKAGLTMQKEMRQENGKCSERSRALLYFCMVFLYVTLFS
jgi:hypothetical protein